MKKRHFIILSVLVAIIVILWCWPSQKQFVGNPATKIDSSSGIAGDINTHTNSSGIDAHTTQMTAVELAALQADPYRKFTNSINEGQSEWRTPIDFYGIVVDELSNSVANADINFVWNDTSLKGTSEEQTSSDAQGLFFLHGKRGKFLSVTVTKTDYYAYKPFGEGFFYAGENENFVPDANNPVVFRLHKKGRAEPLIAREFPGFAQIEQLRRDGTPVEIDLLQAKKVASGGQLKIEFMGDRIERTTKMFNWKARVSVPGGGIVVTAEEFNFNAPENGYAPQIEIDMPTTTEHWASSIKQKYFIKFADGNYGRIDFDFLARNGVYRIHSFVNPSGSRNLEYDEAVQPKPSVQE